MESNEEITRITWEFRLRLRPALDGSRRADLDGSEHNLRRLAFKNWRRDGCAYDRPRRLSLPDDLRGNPNCQWRACTSSSKIQLRGSQRAWIDECDAMMASILFVTWRTLDGPFSAVSRPTIARLDAFFSIFQNLHVVRSFAPLETQFFLQKSRLFFLQVLLFIAVKPDFMTNFLTNFDEILTKSWRNFDERWRILTNSDEFWRILTNFAMKIRQKFVKNLTNEFVIRHFWVTNWYSSPS